MQYKHSYCTVNMTNWRESRALLPKVSGQIWPLPVYVMHISFRSLLNWWLVSELLNREKVTLNPRSIDVVYLYNNF